MQPTPARILFVDDDQDTCVAMARLLELQGYDPRCAGSCAEARQLIDDGPFDVLVADYLLLDGDGLTVLNYAQRRYPVEGILISGVDSRGEDVVTSAAAAHFAARLIKPIEFAQLHCAIQELLDPSRRAAVISASAQAARKAERLKIFREQIKALSGAELGKVVTEMKRHGEDLREEIAALAQALQDQQPRAE